MKELLTVGHGARTIEELISVLTGAGVQLLVDVRRFPGSRRNPHFSREALTQSLPAAGVTYEWRGEALGGRRKPHEDSRHHAWRNDAFRAYAGHIETEEFRTALDDLEARAASVRQAVMCAETLWWRCHRRLIADALVADGFEVTHIGLGKDAAHTLSEFARLDARGLLVYDVEPDRPPEL